MEHLTHHGTGALEPLPSQSSPIPAGRYLVEHGQEAYVSADSDQTRSAVWFKTPPLNEDTIRRMRGLRLFAESHDQGMVSDKCQGNWTWFELAILENESDTSPRWENGVQLVQFYESNRMASKKYRWLNGPHFEKKEKDLLNFLKPGNCIAVRICARFPGWAIYVKSGLLVLEIGNEPTQRKHVPMGDAEKTVYEIRMIDKTIQKVNNYTQSTFKTALPGVVYNIDEIKRGQDEDALRVLCLAVMKQVSPQDPNKKPCDVFDMIGGTSTGGLIAIMLGCLKMTVQECITQYEQTIEKVFNKSFWPNGKLVWDGSYYTAKVLEEEIKRIIRVKLGEKHEDDKLLNGNNKCKVFVMAVDKDSPNNSAPVFLRSYTNPRNQSNCVDIKIWEAARATSAAPSYFAPIQVEDAIDPTTKQTRTRTLVDGGLAANNPLGWLWTEIVGVFGPSRPTQCFLSIGTGIPGKVPLPDNLARDPYNGMIALSSVATNTEMTHVLFQTLVDSFAPDAGQTKYWRLNIKDQIMHEVEEGWIIKTKKCVEVKMDDGDQGAREAMKRATTAFVQKEENLIKGCAVALTV
ncbi:FabD/lysophospholipase-like protein [Neofusicoccum parvum]|nr:FabD/lysophospholipase-like protein [Neofusicoccum parvum]